MQLISRLLLADALSTSPHPQRHPSRNSGFSPVLGSGDVAARSARFRVLYSRSMHADAAKHLARTERDRTEPPARDQPAAPTQYDNMSTSVSAWRAVLPAYVVSRIGLLLIGYTSMLIVPLGPSDAPWQFLPNDPMFDSFVRWDSGWYRTILSRGYYYDSLNHENIHFFPLYPLLVGGLMIFIPKSVNPDAAFAYVAVFASHVAFYAGLAGVCTLALLKSDRAAAKRCVWLMSLFPYSFFFSAAYTESTYLALAVWAFVHAERRQWAQASLMAALASGTRIPGLFVGVSIAFIYFAQRRYGSSAPRTQGFWLLAAPLGCLLYLAYLGVRFHDPLLLVHVSTNLPGHYARGIFMHITHVFSQNPDLANVSPNDHRPVACEPASSGVTVAGRLFGSAYAFFPMASMALPLFPHARCEWAVCGVRLRIWRLR
jgi:hypothetical protein